MRLATDGAVPSGSGRLHDALLKAGIWAGFLVLWHVISVWADSLFLPAPLSVAHRTVEILTIPEFTGIVGVTVFRVAVSVALVFAISAVLIVLARRFTVFEYVRYYFGFLLPYGVPGLVWVFIVLIVVGIESISPLIIIVIACLPYALINLEEGVREMDGGLVKMADAFSDSPYRRFRHVVLPLLLPSIIAAFRSVLVMAWKAVLFAEYFITTNGIGFQFHEAMTAYDGATMMAWGVIMTAIILGIDVSLKAVDRNYLRRYRYVAADDGNPT